MATGQFIGLRIRRATSRRKPLRGVAVVLVLGLLAITLAIAYATLRGQGTTAQLAHNNSRAADAREAARSGLAAALKKMSEENWAGVAAPLGPAHITANSWYEVTFTTGDALLTPADPKYSEYPFRVTVESVGYAADPANPNVQAIHKSRCVVQLVRRALLAEPANWSALTGFTVYQYGNHAVPVQFPVRVNGTAHINGPMTLCPDYASEENVRREYLEGLEGMREDGRGDHRPFDSPLTIALGRQSDTTLDLLNNRLDLAPLLPATSATTAPLTHPGSVSSYRLYPGGKEYTIPVLQTQYGSTLQNVTLGPDPLNNPLGVFRSSGSLTIQNNVQITGTVIAETLTSDIQVSGTSIVIGAANLPRLSGTTLTHQLPVVLALDDLEVNSLATATITGVALAWDEFELKTGLPETQFALQGSLITNKLMLRGRSTWKMTSTAWTNDYNDFNDSGGLLGNLLDALFDTIRNSLGLDDNDEVYFPEYMQQVRGFTVQPALTFSPKSSAVTPHWHDWTQPIYQKGSSDQGLIWDLIRWEDGE